jgi:hypothetical protein
MKISGLSIYLIFAEEAAGILQTICKRQRGASLAEGAT